MMKIYQYVSYREKRKLVFECTAESMSEADKLFQDHTGLDPVKATWIGCSVKGKATQT